MIAHTDQAIKRLLELRFGMSAIWTGETVALLTHADSRFSFPSEVNDYIANQGEVKFPFCSFIRTPGSFDAARFNTAVAKMGVVRGYLNQDKTRLQLVKMIPVLYPYAIKYYCSNVYESIKLEKLYWGLQIEPYLDGYIKNGFPDDFNSNFADFKIYISTLEGFEPPTTDTAYEKGRFYTGSMGFTVSTWIAENIEVPVVKEVVTQMYEKTPDKALDVFSAGDKTSWNVPNDISS